MAQPRSQSLLLKLDPLSIEFKRPFDELKQYATELIAQGEPNVANFLREIARFVTLCGVDTAPNTPRFSTLRELLWIRF